MTAAALLRSYSKLSLERMAKQRRLETKGQNKEALMNMLAPILFDADAIRRALVALSPVERRVLDEVRLLGGDAPTGLIKQRLEREGTRRWPPFRKPWPSAASWPVPARMPSAPTWHRQSLIYRAGWPGTVNLAMGRVGWRGVSVRPVQIAVVPRLSLSGRDHRPRRVAVLPLQPESA